MEEQSVIRVLIAEDDPIQSELLRDALEMEPDLACCGQARDGSEALRLVRAEQPDVLLLDIVMPRMDGIDLLLALQDDSPPKRPYIIVHSAHGQEHIAREALSHGADWFMLKPYPFDLLFRRIRGGGSPPAPQTLEQTVTRVVLDLGVQTDTLGYEYLKQALMILLTRQGACLMSKDVYEAIAAGNGTSGPCVEKALRCAIKQAFRSGSERLRRLLETGRLEGAAHLSNRRFLTLLAEAIRQEFIVAEDGAAPAGGKGA